MKKFYLKVIPIFIIALGLFLTFMFGRDNLPSSMTFQENKEVDLKVAQIIKENEDKELIANEVYNSKFVYLAFQNGEDVVSYILDSKTGEEKDFEQCLKPGKKEEFDAKIKELLYLKYPVFIADALSKEDVEYTYQIRENELVIHYSNVVTEPKIDEKILLRINYNEIKDYLDFTLSLDAEYENENGYVYDKNKKSIAFTFDDGPNRSKTPQIVEALEQNKAHATFFMVGNKMDLGSDIIRNVLDKGNEIGSHSYSHKNLKRQKIADVISGEEKTNEIYHSITGQDLIYTRPPYGAINAEIKSALNTIFITWNLDTQDWLHRDKDYIVNYVMSNVKDGDIILMHDSYNSTVEAVQELLPKLYAAGYQVVSVSELANLKGITLEEHLLYRKLKEVE